MKNTKQQQKGRQNNNISENQKMNINETPKNQPCKNSTFRIPDHSSPPLPYPIRSTPTRSRLPTLPPIPTATLPSCQWWPRSANHFFFLGPTPRATTNTLCCKGNENTREDQERRTREKIKKEDTKRNHKKKRPQKGRDRKTCEQNKRSSKRLCCGRRMQKILRTFCQLHWTRRNRKHGRWRVSWTC
jgi:hypothetical protein